MNLIFFFNYFIFSNIYEFNYNFNSDNLDNRMYVSFKNSNFRESVIMPNQIGKFLLDSKINNFSYNFRYPNINNFDYNIIEKKNCELIYSNRKYNNIILKNNYFYDFIQYNSSKMHNLEIFFSTNFFKYKSKNNIYFKIYHNNKILFDEKIIDNYINFYFSFTNNYFYNLIRIEIFSEKYFNNCVTCDNGYLYSYFFAILKKNIVKNKNNNFTINKYYLNLLTK